MDVEIAKKQILVANALKRVLKPLVRLMLSNGLGYNFAIDLLKSLFVKVAEEEFALDRKRQTDSRISLISGVHRKDVRRLRERLPSVEEVIPANIPLSSQIIAVWNAKPRYLDENGMPKPIPRFSVTSEDDSYENLVRGISTDIHPRAVLDELLRTGVVRLDSEGMVHLVSDAFIPQEDYADKVFYLGNNLHDHAQAAVANVVGIQPKFFERCVHYDNLTQASIAEIDAISRKIGSKSLRDVNKLADERSSADAGKDGDKFRMTYGIYFYAEAVDKPGEDS